MLSRTAVFGFKEYRIWLRARQIWADQSDMRCQRFRPVEVMLDCFARDVLAFERSWEGPRVGQQDASAVGARPKPRQHDGQISPSPAQKKSNARAGT